MPKLTERRDGTAFRDYLERWKPPVFKLGTMVEGYALHSWSREPGGVFNGQSLYRIHEEYRKPEFPQFTGRLARKPTMNRPDQAIEMLCNGATSVGSARELAAYIAHLETDRTRFAEGLNDIKRLVLEWKEVSSKATAAAEAPALGLLGLRIRRINLDNGWDCMKPADWPESNAEIEKVRKIATGLMLITTEVAEAMEGLRKRDRTNVGEELTDVLIRTLDMMTGLGFDIDEEVRAKMEKNRTRGFKHGGKAV